ncbi:SRPBCC domain-containing protein [Emticicia sp. 21SJ11W-3]|uniref:SRPBCC domain-containing protein n=1 Tax=Emticicia sp. 21SJ11W-3 TaxID=2916755 RepID=UPI00286DCBA5|nr:SRPBCC domain-containing protein [Emticicia sp. 21SJ11W-3]
MRQNLIFDFTVNKENNTVEVKREFAADLDLVWEAWTNPAILDQWWAPKPYRTETKSMNFREGGRWHYAMISPKGEKHWGVNDYLTIETQKGFSCMDAFSDENGTIDPNLPRTYWNNDFKQTGSTTFVTINARYNSLSDLEKVIEMGFKEGFSMALENLDQYLEAQFMLRRQNKTNNKARVCTYLNFAGNTEEAFLFYKSVFRTDFVGKGIQRFGDIPAVPGNPPVADAVKNMILHVELPITAHHILMATDAPKEMGFTLTLGNNMHISIEPDTREEAKRIFDELSAGGVVSMPLEDMFFGAYFGSFTDKFGINWMINYQND